MAGRAEGRAVRDGWGFGVLSNYSFGRKRGQGLLSVRIAESLQVVLGELYRFTVNFKEGLLIFR